MLLDVLTSIVLVFVSYKVGYLLGQAEAYTDFLRYEYKKKGLESSKSKRS